MTRPVVPLDDPVWPRSCRHDKNDVTCDAYRENKGWCVHVAETIRSNQDGIRIDAAPIVVPYLPLLDLYAWVEIGDEVDPEAFPEFRRLYLVRSIPLMPPGHETNLEELGFWHPSERRASICLTVRDWVRGQRASGDLPCPFIRHGYREQAKVAGLDSTQLEVNDFYKLTQGACWFCYQEIKKIDSGNGTFIDPDDVKVSAKQAHIKGKLGSVSP